MMYSYTSVNVHPTNRYVGTLVNTVVASTKCNNSLSIGKYKLLKLLIWCSNRWGLFRFIKAFIKKSVPNHAIYSFSH